MRGLCLVAAACGFLSMTGWAVAADYALTYQGSNKWLAVGDKAPLLGLRRDLVAAQDSRVQVVLPPEGRELSAARLAIIAEVLGRKVPDLIIEEITGTTPVNTLLFKTAH